MQRLWLDDYTATKLSVKAHWFLSSRKGAPNADIDEIGKLASITAKVNITSLNLHFWS
jgi:hypothetical protein